MVTVFGSLPSAYVQSPVPTIPEMDGIRKSSAENVCSS